MSLIKLRLLEPTTGTVYVRAAKVNAIFTLAVPVGASGTVMRVLPGSDLEQKLIGARLFVGPMAVDVAVNPHELAAEVARLTEDEIEDLSEAEVEVERH